MPVQPPLRPSSPHPSFAQEDSPDTSITTTEPDSDAEYCHHVFPSVSDDDLIPATTSPAPPQPTPAILPRNLHRDRQTSTPSETSAIDSAGSQESASLSPASSSVYYDALSYILDDPYDEAPTTVPTPLSPLPLIVVTPDLGAIPTARAQAALPPTLRRGLPLSEAEYYAVIASRIARLEAETDARWENRQESGPTREESDDAMDIDRPGDITSPSASQF